MQVEDSKLSRASSFFTKIIKSNKGRIKMQEFGLVKSTNEKAYLFTIENKNGMSIDLTTLGATLTAIRVPDKNGKHRILRLVGGAEELERAIALAAGK